MFSLFTADQLVWHLVGDYILQSSWMAENKTKDLFPAVVHAFFYTLPFVIFLGASPKAAVVIFATHMLIDRYRLIRYVIWLRNRYPGGRPWSECTATGFPNTMPPWLSVWLMIISDNVLHIFINGFSLKFL